MQNNLQTSDYPETRLFTLQLPSQSDSIARVELLVEEIADNYHVAEDTFANMMTCLSEAVNNAITHGNGQEVDKKVIINAEVDARRVVWTVADEGPGFDPDQLPDPTAPENVENLTGRGVFIMKQLADQCVFNGNVMELHFKI